MQKTFETENESKDSPKWQRVTISDEADEKRDGCKYCIEIEYAKNVSIPAKQKNIHRLIHVDSLSNPKANFKVDFNFLTAVRIIGNIDEALTVIGENLYIRFNIMSRLLVDSVVNNWRKESSTYVLPPEIVDLDKVKLPKLTAEDYEEFGMTPPLVDNQPRTPRSKAGFFESGDNANSSRSNSNPLSVNTTPEKNPSTPEEPSNAIPSPVSPTIKVK